MFIAKFAEDLRKSPLRQAIPSLQSRESTNVAKNAIKVFMFLFQALREPMFSVAYANMCRCLFGVILNSFKYLF